MRGSHSVAGLSVDETRSNTQNEIGYFGVSWLYDPVGPTRGPKTMKKDKNWSHYYQVGICQSLTTVVKDREGDTTNSRKGTKSDL